MGSNGIKPESVRVPECSKCENFACYTCWSKHILENGKCPGDHEGGTCNHQVNIPEGIRDRIKGQQSRDLEIDEDLEDFIDIDDYINWIGKRKLRNILMNLRIEHHCTARKKQAEEEAEKLWNENFEELLESSRKREDIDERIHEMKSRMEKQLDAKSAMLEGGSMSDSSWDAEGGNDSEVPVSETRD